MNLHSFDNVLNIPPQQKSNEWYTPALYIEAARQVMGGIDLDPASCELANRTVKATKFYTKDDNGLALPWYGRVWLNPPYGRVHPALKGSTNSYQVHFLHTLRKGYVSGHIDQAVALVFGTSLCMPWFRTFLAFPMCIARTCITFHTPDHKDAYFGYGNIFLYLGPNEDTFIEVFSRFGTIMRSVSMQQHESMQSTLWQTVDMA